MLLLNNILAHNCRKWIPLFKILQIYNIHTDRPSDALITDVSSSRKGELKIESEKEADLKQGKISVTSPIGKGLLGKIIGDIAEVSAPAGVLKFKIENITV